MKIEFDPKVTKTEDMTPAQIVEAGEKETTYLTKDPGGNQVVVDTNPEAE